jgi:tetratricopeptide (TPR) repeat protein
MASSSTFVGRERELAELVAGLDDAVAGRGRLFLIGGEPGIGKSALSDELARHALERSVRVLSGRCWEAGGAPPYWPWVQSIRALLEELDADSVRRHVGPLVQDLAQMLPELRPEAAGDTEGTSPDPDTARFRLFDSAATFLRNAARDRPLVVILEDLHAADTPSLLLLEFVTRSLAATRALIIATYRDVEVGREHPLATTLPELSREGVTRRITLTGLHQEDVESFIVQSAGVEPARRLVDTVYRETEGNPLFIGEIVRLLASEGRLSKDTEATMKPIPQGIRDVIARRVGHVSESCNHVLGIASVLGREFTLDVLGELSERSTEDLLEILDEAAAARLVSDTPGVLGGIRFSHSLIRDSMYEDLSPSRRVRLHRRAAELLETIREGNPEHLAEIAHHYFAGAATGDSTKAVHYARSAAEHALRRLAFEEAARLFAMALQAMQLGEAPDQSTRFELLLALADALTRAGDAESAREHAYEAAEIARRRGDAHGLGRSALLYGGTFTWAALRGDTRFVPLLEEALAAVTAAGEDVSMRVRLMGRLAAGPFRDLADPLPRLQLASEAVELARKLGDPATLAYALEARLASIIGPVPADLDEVLEVSEEIERAASATNDGEQVLMSHVWRLLAHLYYGDIPKVKAERRALAQLAEQLRQRPQDWFLTGIDAQMAFFGGRFADAERLAAEAYEAGRRVEGFALFAFRAQMLWMRMEQGRESEMADEFADSNERFVEYAVWRGLAPYLLLSYGTETEARAAFREAFQAPRPINEEYLLSAGALAEAAAALGERDAAASLYDELLPHAHLTMGGIPDINIGATSRLLGRLAHTVGRLDDAERHFIDAIASNDRMGARPWAAWARHAYARLLVERGGPGDLEHASALFAEARQVAAELGMVALERSIAAAMGSETELPADVAAAAAVFRREGEYWTIAFEGAAFRLRDSKGLQYVARLLAAPGRELHALDLVASEADSSDHVVSAPRDAELHAGADDAGPVLDDKAKVAYRTRLAEIDADIEEARSWGDDERAARGEEERDALVQQLAGAVGLGGRDRRAASAAERARVNVTRAIKAAVARVAEQNPALGKHLEATLRTGTFCSYTPDTRLEVSWLI